MTIHIIIGWVTTYGPMILQGSILNTLLLYTWPIGSLLMYMEWYIALWTDVMRACLSFIHVCLVIYKVDRWVDIDSTFYTGYYYQERYWIIRKLYHSTDWLNMTGGCDSCLLLALLTTLAVSQITAFHHQPALLRCVCLAWSPFYSYCNATVLLPFDLW